MNKAEFDDIAPSLPALPGVYKYFDRTDKIIYVGKAKHLRKRITSYFAKHHDYYKTERLVEEIRRIEFTITNNEQDAFLLENSLIKHFQPKYNIELKDDKTYPFIIIKKEPFPRVFLTRRYIRDGSEYLGPYTSIDQVRSLLEFIRETIPLRTCSLALTQKNIQANKFVKPCLEYHIGKCKAPCVGWQSQTEYDEQIQEIREILKGKFGQVIQHLKKEMQTYADAYEFEKAELIKKKIEYIGQYQRRSVVVNTSMNDVDVCSIMSNDEHAYVNYMQVVQGAVIQTHTATVKKKLQESDEDILPIVVQQLRERFRSLAHEIVAPFSMLMEEELKITVPQAGDKKKLLDMSVQNAQYFVMEQRRKKALNLVEESDEYRTQTLLEIQAGLHLQEVPLHIECFDNSNFQGSYPVAAMVCFKNGLPFKSEFRHFHIKTVQGINDFASMKEIVYRRYKRVLEENKPLPNLIIIDGGKGQLSSAIEALNELNVMGKTQVVGLAKQVEEIFFPGDSESIRLPFQSNALNLIKRIRDEVHRFGITFHRKTRSEGTIKNELETIPGIGEKTASDLLKKFRSVKKVKEASMENLSDVVGPAKAKMVYDYFHP